MTPQTLVVIMPISHHSHMHSPLIQEHLRAFLLLLYCDTTQAPLSEWRTTDEFS